MNHVTSPIEVLPPEQRNAHLQPLVLKIDDGLEPSTVLNLQEQFGSFFEQADRWRAQALAIQITSPSQVREMKLARETRLALREIRINAEKTRKRLKEDGLRKGKAIDGIYNVLAYAIEPLEEHLLAQEKFIEKMEAEQKAKLKADRETQLLPFGVDCSLYQLGEMTEEAFSQLLETNRLAYAARQEAAWKAEAERIERERLEAEERARREAEAAAERERLRQENERLAREKAEQEAAAKADREAREKAEAEHRAKISAMENERKAELDRIERERIATAQKARQEREARERAEAELRAHQEAKEEQERAAKAALTAPDRDKLDAFVKALRDAVPSMTTETGKGIETLIRTQVEKFAAWIENQKTKLN